MVEFQSIPPIIHSLITHTHREWWVSAEAMVGFLNAGHLSGEAHFYEKALRSWQFIQQHLLDRPGGEWRWGVFDDYRPMEDEDKIGFWKCPYHNVRACLEVIRRLAAQQLTGVAAVSC